MFGGQNFQNEKAIAVIKIRAKLLHAARRWLDENGYVEVHGPTLVPAVGYWLGHFEVKYFDKKAYLVQGLQPYANVFVAWLGKIYTIAPAFRAERVRTQRHLTEFWRIEVAQQCELDVMIEVQEKLVAHICHSLSKEAVEMLECFDRSVMDLEGVQTPFPKLTYDEAIDLLQRDGFNVSWGQTLDWELEKHLSHRFSQPFFITKFPISIETFFHKSDPEKPELTLSVDLLAPEGYGEIGSGAQRITEKKVLLQKMAEEKINPADQQWYMSFMQRRAFPHSGFMIGLERLIQWICKLKHIEEAVVFPRLSDSVYS
ncbi:asparagine--tRNA ligase [Candidatus Bathyarchaeota archaeon A05DMB-2]|jgi:asparaginyl-tRNA synthetase|nr:asparagine--tRNA ligase [Candidatus Bathyarchaeota archaeon A05DMB-2]